MSSERTYIPSEADIKLSQDSSRILASHRQQGSAVSQLKVVEDDGTEQAVTIPAGAYNLLTDLLTQIAQGNAVTLIPIHAELTTQEAANFLNVSRPHVVKLLDSGEIPFRKVGTHRRILFEDLRKYKQDIDDRRLETLSELTAQAQELGMGY